MTDKLRCYYAHCKGAYGTKQETRDIILLSQLGFDVLNPGSKEIARQFKAWKNANSHIKDLNTMDFFTDLVLQCQVLAFRALPFTYYVTSGVWIEIDCARKAKHPVIELPTNISGRGLTHEATIEYLKEIGER